MSQTNWKNVNNWHWTEKNCFQWAQKYFKDVLPGTTVASKGLTATITEVVDIKGDVDLNQRKGKLITLFDLSMTLAWKGTTRDGEEVSGRIEIPEIAHDTDLDDFVFDTALDSPHTGARADDVRQIVRVELANSLRPKLKQFSRDLIEAHAKDVYIDAGTQSPESSDSRPKPKLTSNDSRATAATSVASTTTIEDHVEFVCSAIDLWLTFLHPERVEGWAREKIDIEPVVGKEFRLFNGNVTGKVLELEPGKWIKQTWRLYSWPKDFYSTVEITLKESSSSTKLHLVQKNVPLADAGTVKQNWRNYYWNPIKQTFGYGAAF
jgi:activator of HSP90 ATPase